LALDAFTFIPPAMLTFPLANRITAVLFALGTKVIVTPAGMLIVVKLKMPLKGS
jgi:hypothetical protein